ncbi:Enoyl-CoA hydratase [Arthrobacter sp. 9V]|uniref:enoyl-CoA hydratase/isomerase family protein n=1 Tax=Arthrobacter sp. 9V TaxID=2653132 RepID=UPI0012F17229|nr:enoyl-CoA hydratase/isomerase family protein [Arthrobacter sp. 9V]VXB66029.1 Enoyl-CoA hydratase [Arthrobacter sp. 9V]
MTTLTDTVLLTEQHDAVLIATLNRPAKGNSLSTELIDALGALAAELRSPTHEGTKAVILTGAGQKAFSAGADINTLVGLDAAAAEAQMLHGQKVFDELEDLPQAVIAAIDGVAFGGGLELAMACDLRVASPTSRLGQPEITLANLPGWGGTQRLPRLIGQGRALEMILTGEPMSASRALEIGLLNAVSEDPLAAAHNLAARITRHSGTAVSAAKQAIYAGEREGITEGLRREAFLVGQCCESPEQREAVQKFLNRKKSN